MQLQYSVDHGQQLRLRRHCKACDVSLLLVVLPPPQTHKHATGQALRAFSSFVREHDLKPVAQGLVQPIRYAIMERLVNGQTREPVR